ncbi:MAG TPA: hypothetical protein VF659_17810 [Pyrinomonadaceae bacterium]|jgi:hypothetical protein
MQKSKPRAAEEIFLVVFFLAAVSVPLGLLLVRGEGKAAWENRKLAELPARPRTPRDVYHLPPKLSEYFKDHFGLRAELIRWQATAKMDWLRTSGSPQVLLGREGWLFHAGEREVEMYTGADPFTPQGLEVWGRYLQGLGSWAEGRGASFVVAFVPEKQTIYPELMPGGLARGRGASRQDQLIEYLKGRPGVRFVDLRPAVAEAKGGAQVYMRTDTHWNQLGSFAAYGALARELGRDFPGVRPSPLSDYEVRQEQFSGDLAGMLGLRGVIWESVPRLRPKGAPRARFEGDCNDVGVCSSEAEGEGLPRVLMFRDSAAAFFIPFLAEHVSRGVYVWDTSWSFPTELLERERPDVVVLEMVERNLMKPPVRPIRAASPR